MNTNSLINQKKYIDLDSTYRDRKLWPLPTEFEVNINAATRDTPSTALDPIILAFPYATDLTSALSTPTQIPLSVNSSSIRNFYQGSYLEIGGVFRLITFYDELTQVATVSPAFGGAFPALTAYSIRKALPFQGPTVTGGAAVSNTTIVLNATASAIDNFYVNYYVFVPGATPPSTYQYARIVSYDGPTRTAILATPFVAPVGAGVTYEILEFNRDNVVPLRFSGNQVINNPTSYEIVLVNLIIPNRYILNGYGGTLGDYSHIYVSLYSASARTSTNSIYSNNNNSLQALFKVPISSLFLSVNQQFYTLQFSHMKQTISFRENDTLHFKISLPNGNTIAFVPINKDTYFQDYIGKFPIECDPLEQVTVLFEINRLSAKQIENKTSIDNEEPVKPLSTPSAPKQGVTSISSVLAPKPFTVPTPAKAVSNLGSIELGQTPCVPCANNDYVLQ